MATLQNTYYSAAADLMACMLCDYLNTRGLNSSDIVISVEKALLCALKTKTEPEIRFNDSGVHGAFTMCSYIYIDAAINREFIINTLS